MDRRGGQRQQKLLQTLQRYLALRSPSSPAPVALFRQTSHVRDFPAGNG